MPEAVDSENLKRRLRLKSIKLVVAVVLLARSVGPSQLEPEEQLQLNVLTLNDHVILNEHEYCHACVMGCSIFHVISTWS